MEDVASLIGGETWRVGFDDSTATTSLGFHELVKAGKIVEALGASYRVADHGFVITTTLEKLKKFAHENHSHIYYFDKHSDEPKIHRE